MTQHDTALTLRPITGPEELPLFNSFDYKLNEEIADDLVAGRRRPEWLWMALRGDRVVGRAGWWSRPGDEHPFLMDILDGDALPLVEAALAALVPPGANPPDHLQFVPGNWRDDPAARQVVDNRMAILERLGAKLFVERLRLDWQPGGVLPPAPRRLTVRPVRDASELIDLMTLVLDGTLDAHSRDDLTRMTPREAAEEQYRDELQRYASPHEWWRVATLPDGDPVGFVIPAHNDYNPIIAYIGVVPAHRGQGYIDEILAAGTRLLAAEGVTRIRAATDVGNVPMARAFERAGYLNFERQLDMTWR